jgi:glycerate dehydrogenase
MTFAHILNITNRIGHYARQSREGRWSSNPDFCYWDTQLWELSGKTIGIVGLGNIGMRVATIARYFGMDVFAFTSKNSADLPEGIQKTTLDGLFAVSDIVSLHCPLTADTRHLINRESLEKMKEGSILINTGRGPLVDEEAVADALASGHLGGYGADVMIDEPPSPNNPLLAQRNAFITPHIAWATREARQRLMDICVRNVKAFIEGKRLNAVNA